MDVAVEIIGNHLKMFIEGMPLYTLLKKLNGETIQVKLLVYTNGVSSTFHDSTHTDSTLTFCKQPLSASLLIKELKNTGLSLPTELEIFNEQLYLSQFYPGAYRLTLLGNAKDGLYLDFIKRVIPAKQRSAFLDSLSKYNRAATSGLQQQFFDASVERFAQMRFDRWHEKIVAEFLEAQRSGSVDSNGCVIIDPLSR